VRAEILAESVDEPDYSWKPVRGGKDLTLSHELSPAAHRPCPPDAWDVFDAAVLRLGLAMENKSIAEVRAATEALSVTISQLADLLDELIGPYPWYVDASTSAAFLGSGARAPRARDCCPWFGRRALRP
jgi:hypothetical protein